MLVVLSRIPGARILRARISRVLLVCSLVAVVLFGGASPASAGDGDGYGNGSDTAGSNNGGVAVAEVNTVTSGLTLYGPDTTVHQGSSCAADEAVLASELIYIDESKDVIDPIWVPGEQIGETEDGDPIFTVGYYTDPDVTTGLPLLDHPPATFDALEINVGNDRIRVTQPAGSCRQSACQYLQLEDLQSSTSTSNTVAGGLDYGGMAIIMSIPNNMPPADLPIINGTVGPDGTYQYQYFTPTEHYVENEIPTVWFCVPQDVGDLGPCDLIVAAPTCFITNMGVYYDNPLDEIVDFWVNIANLRDEAKPSEPEMVTSPDSEADGLNWVKWAMWTWIETPEGVVAEATNPENTIRVRVYGMPADVEFDYGDGETLACRSNDIFTDNADAPLMKEYISGTDPTVDTSECSHEYLVASEEGADYVLTAGSNYQYTYTTEYRASAAAPWPLGDDLIAAAQSGDPVPAAQGGADEVFDSEPVDVEVNEIHSLVAAPD